MSPRGGIFAEFGVAFDSLHKVFESGPVILSPGPYWVGKLSFSELERARIFEASFLGNGEATGSGNLAECVILASQPLGENRSPRERRKL
jgi:hypothetical protein